MSDALIGPQKGWPRWANRVVLWIGIPTGILLALVAFFGAAKDLGGYMRSGCELAHVCAAPKSAPPVLANYASPWVDGGHSATDYCEPQAEHYRQVHPQFNISWRALGEGRDKDWKGHATYQYNCAFEVNPK